MRACENFGRTAAPFLPQCVQVKLGSMSGEPDRQHGFDVMAAAVIVGAKRGTYQDFNTEYLG
jgi:hypothetical protein